MKRVAERCRGGEADNIKFVAMDTNAKDKASTLYNLATAYEGKGNNAKACGYYKQILTDPTYKQIAEYKVKTQLKCN